MPEPGAAKLVAEEPEQETKSPQEELPDLVLSYMLNSKQLKGEHGGNYYLDSVLRDLDVMNDPEKNLRWPGYTNEDYTRLAEALKKEIENNTPSA